MCISISKWQYIRERISSVHWTSRRERPCSDDDPMFIENKDLEWCPDPFKDGKDGEAIVQGITNITMIVINMILLIAIRPYRCLECKLEETRINTK